jgi:hypothetical protein
VGTDPIEHTVPPLLVECLYLNNRYVLLRVQHSLPITNAPWYVSNYTLHNDLQIPFITEEIKRYSTLYYNRLIDTKTVM